MGGNLFKDLRRHETAELKAKEITIKEWLTLDLNIDCHSIPCLSDKDSHGDLDLIVNRQTFSLDDLYSIATLYDYTINGKHVNIHQIPYDDLLEIFKRMDVVSFNYFKLQVDLIFIDEDSVDFAIKYHSYNDLGGIIGCITKQLGYSLGREGLFYEILPIEGYSKYKIYLTKDFKEFCDVFEVDDSIYYGTNSLANVDEMYDYLKKWKYFNSEWMSPSLMNSTRKNRASKRTVFTQIENMAKHENGCINYDKPAPELIYNFNEDVIEEQVKEAYRLAEIERKRKLSFSKERMVRVLGYEPENCQHIFLNMSMRYGGPDQTRKATSEMTDDEFKQFINSVIEDIK